MDYKKIIKSRALRHNILHMLNWVPDKLMVRLQYKIHTGRTLNLNDPKRYTEKLQWYKCNYRNAEITRCVDKEDVHNYLKEKGFSEYLNEVYGVYDDIKDVDFSKLPNQFVVKTTDGGGNTEVYVCKNKTNADVDAIIKQFNPFVGRKLDKSFGREWAYNNIGHTRFIIEKYLEDEATKDSGLWDYKFLCFNGKVKCVVLDVDRNIAHKRNFYTPEWKNLNIEADCPQIDREIPRPKFLDDMIRVAEEMSKDFPHVRVDLYNVNGKIVFGELTFYPWSGYVSYTPDSADYMIGDFFDLPQ